MERSKLYETLEKVEGGEKIKDAVKSMLNGLDADVKKYRESSDEMGKKVDSLTEDFNGLKSQLKEANTNSVPKTEMEEQIAAIQETLGIITGERDEAMKVNQENEKISKDSALKDHFSKSVADIWSAKNVTREINSSFMSGAIAYTKDGEMSYNGKTGDDAIELFKSDNSDLISNNGHNTSGGSPTPNTNFKPAETSFKGFQNVASSMA